jgi:hypothetical protein
MMLNDSQIYLACVFRTLEIINSSGNSKSCSITLGMQVRPFVPLLSTGRYANDSGSSSKVPEQAGDGIIDGRSVWRSGVY